MHGEIYERLTALFRDIFDDDTLVATPSMTAKDVAEWDSLNHIRLIVAIEKAFGISFTTAEVAAFANVSQMADVIAVRASPQR